MVFLCRKPMTYKTYILFSPSKNRFYIGSTSDELSQRIRRHNTNHKGFTGNNADWILMYYEQFSTKKEALDRERQIKAWKSKVKILALINKLSWFSASRPQSGGSAVRTRVLPQRKERPFTPCGWFFYVHFQRFSVTITLNQLTGSVGLVHPDFSREGPRFEPVCSHRLKKGHPPKADGFFMP